MKCLTGTGVSLLVRVGTVQRGQELARVAPYRQRGDAIHHVRLVRVAERVDLLAQLRRLLEQLRLHICLHSHP